MKNSIKNLLRAGVFVLAAVFAFAFTEPVPKNQQYYAMIGGNWQNVTSIVASGNYACPESPGNHCLYLSESTEDPRPGEEYEDKVFQPLPAKE